MCDVLYYYIILQGSDNKLVRLRNQRQNKAVYCFNCAEAGHFGHVSNIHVHVLLTYICTCTLYFKMEAILDSYIQTWYEVLRKYILKHL